MSTPRTCASYTDHTGCHHDDDTGGLTRRALETKTSGAKIGSYQLPVGEASLVPNIVSMAATCAFTNADAGWRYTPSVIAVVACPATSAAASGISCAGRAALSVRDAGSDRELGDPRLWAEFRGDEEHGVDDRLGPPPIGDEQPGGNAHGADLRQQRRLPRRREGRLGDRVFRLGHGKAAVKRRHGHGVGRGGQLGVPLLPCRPWQVLTSNTAGDGGPEELGDATGVLMQRMELIEVEVVELFGVVRADHNASTSSLSAAVSHC